MFFALLPFRFVSCRHSMSTFLRFMKSASSLPLPVIVPIFKVLTKYPYECLSPFPQFPLPLHLPSSSLSPLVFAMFSSGIIPPVSCRATPEAVVGNRAATDPLWIHDHNAFVCLAKVYAGCPSCRNPSHLL